jgi:hypothetical protein
MYTYSKCFVLNWERKNNNKKIYTFRVITPKTTFINSLLWRRVCFCGHIVRYTLFLKEPYIFLGVRLHFMFLIQILVQIYDMIMGLIVTCHLWSYQTYVPTVASRPVRQCTVTQTRCCPWHRFPRGDLQFDASLRTHQDKEYAVCDRSDPLRVCDTVL